MMEWMLFSITIIASRILCSSSEANWPWSTEHETRLERVLEGHDVVLRCAGRLENATAHWEYKACGSGLNQSRCSVAAGAPGGWVGLPGQPTGRLALRAVEPHQQGLYRCRQSATASIQVHSAVLLEVLTSNYDVDVDLPIFLEGLPKNLTVYKDSPAVFQCKVSSRTPPRLLWLAAGPGVARQQRGWATPLLGAGELGLPGDVHVSKMVLPRARARDAGRYYCVAVNTKGYTNSSAYLEVIGDPEDEWYELSSDGWSLYLLFLLPLTLAVGPALLWGCYVWRTRVNRRKHNYYEEEGQCL